MLQMFEKVQAISVKVTGNQPRLPLIWFNMIDITNSFWDLLFNIRLANTQHLQNL